MPPPLPCAVAMAAGLLVPLAWCVGSEAFLEISQRAEGVMPGKCSRAASAVRVLRARGPTRAPVSPHSVTCDRSQGWWFWKPPVSAEQKESGKPERPGSPGTGRCGAGPRLSGLSPLPEPAAGHGGDVCAAKGPRERGPATQVRGPSDGGSLLFPFWPSANAVTRSKASHGRLRLLRAGDSSVPPESSRCSRGGRGPPHGHHIWEAEAKTDRGLCKPNSLVVEIPPFRNPRITSPVQVSFYVCNGKRKRSQYQHLTYLPANAPTIKTEPADDHEPALTCGPGGQGLSPLPQPRFSQQLVVPPDPGSCLVAGFPPCPQRSTVVSPPPGTGQELHDLSSAAYGKGTASQGHGHLGLQRPAGGVLAVRETPRPVGVHPGPPQQPPPALLQPQSCSPTRPSEMGRQQHRLPKAPRSESAAPRPPPLPEVREDSSHSLAPFPVTVKREPQELDQLYLDDVNEIIRNDLSSTNI
uniref:nuclear factor of activated T-cells, cytoplasmic 1-like n=1 Tax=Panthera onca TaxID=9690 RepID=UPI0029537789|nr:nuclear factor of activated T-cells, cytoplasmic 1-like [Panthera onca]